MAGRSQHTVQIMENQTRFDLNAAVENWRNELAAQPNLASDDRRELETHLRDAVAGFQQRGLNDEESFWLARRRVGQPPQLVEEFVKADPAGIWRERIFWMTIGVVGSFIFTTSQDILSVRLQSSNWLEYFYLIPFFILVGTILMLRRKYAPGFLSRLEIMSRQNRFRDWVLCAGFSFTVLTAYLGCRHLSAGGDGFGSLIQAGVIIGKFDSWISSAAWPAIMVLILLLTPPQNRKTPKRT
jgi:hypothetical protein